VAGGSGVAVAVTTITTGVDVGAGVLVERGVSVGVAPGVAVEVVATVEVGVGVIVDVAEGAAWVGV
jgi:hypothetical protein